MWTKRFAIFCSLFLLASSLVPAQSSPSTDSAPIASPASSNNQSSSWDQLNSLLDQLDQAAIDSSAGSQELRVLLAKAHQQLTALSQQLDESQKRATELSSSIALSEQSLATSAESLRLAQTQVSRRDIELWITRGAVVASLTWAALKK